jgi:hypothetical protein
VVVYEVKTSRSDWLTELSKPEKREWAEFIGNECWFAAPAGVVKECEVPQGWGYLQVTPQHARRVIAAPYRKFADAGQVETLPTSFVSMLCRALVNKEPLRIRPVYVLNGRQANQAEATDYLREAVFKKEIDQARSEAAATARKAEQESHANALALARSVRKRMGKWETPTPEEFAAWLESDESSEHTQVLRRIAELANKALVATE